LAVRPRRVEERPFMPDFDDSTGRENYSQKI